MKNRLLLMLLLAPAAAFAQNPSYINGSGDGYGEMTISITPSPIAPASKVVKHPTLLLKQGQRELDLPHTFNGEVTLVNPAGQIQPLARAVDRQLQLPLLPVGVYFIIAGEQRYQLWVRP